MQKVFRTHGAKVSQESLAPCATLFCTSATPGCTGARGFRSLGSKDLATFGHFPIFDPSPRRSGLQREASRCLAGPSGWQMQEPCKNQGNQTYHRNLSSVTPVSFGKEEFLTGARWRMVSFTRAGKKPIDKQTLL